MVRTNGVVQETCLPSVHSLLIFHALHIGDTLRAVLTGADGRRRRAGDPACYPCRTILATGRVLSGISGSIA